MSKPRGRYRDPSAEHWRRGNHWADEAWMMYELMYTGPISDRDSGATRDEVYNELYTRATTAEAKLAAAEAKLEAVERALDEDRKDMDVAAGVRLPLLRGAIKDALGREADDE